MPDLRSYATASVPTGGDPEEPTELASYLDIIRRFLQDSALCRRVLDDTGLGGDGDSGPLLWLVSALDNDNIDVETLDSNGVESLAPRVALIVHLNLTLGNSLPDLMEDNNTYKERADEADEFEAAIQPMSLASVHLWPARFKSRVQAFSRRLAWSDDEVIRDAFGKVGLIGAANIRLRDEDRRILVERITVRRLRTYHTAMVKEAGEHYLKCRHVIAHIQNRTIAPRRRIDEGWREFVGVVTGILHQKWPGMPKDEIESEVMAAATRTVEGASYHFQLSFATWVIQQVDWWLKDAYRKAKRENELIGVAIQVIGQRGVPTADSAGEAIDATDAAAEIRRKTEAYELVKTTFTADVQPRVDLIWRKSLEEPGLNDADSVIAAQFGVSRECIYTLRKRFNRHMKIVEALQVPPAMRIWTDDRGDCALWTHLRLDKDERPLRRKLAALTRASRDETSLAWAILAYRVIEKAEPLNAIFTELEGRLRRWHIEDPTVAARRKLADAWEGRRTAKWADKNAVREAKAIEKQSGHFRSACWHLAVLRQMGSDRVDDYLLPSRDGKPSEADRVEAYVGLLSKEGA